MLKYVFAAALALSLTSPVLSHSVDAHATHEVITEGAPLGEPGGAFSLIDQSGASFTEKDLVGKPAAIFFGFTSCPDICPTTLYDLTQLRQKLGPNGSKLRVVMVTIDPATDTPEVLKQYLGYFDPSFIGLTGTAAQVAEAASRFYVTQREESGTVRHSASVYLMDAEGKFSSAISYQEDPVSALRKLNALFR